MMRIPWLFRITRIGMISRVLKNTIDRSCLIPSTALRTGYTAGFAAKPVLSLTVLYAAWLRVKEG